MFKIWNMAFILSSLLFSAACMMQGLPSGDNAAGELYLLSSQKFPPAAKK
jgi:hypothetical protein